MSESDSSIETCKRTVKVLQPPGGGSSNIFGGAEPEPAPRKINPQQKSDIFGRGDEPTAAVPATRGTPQKSGKSQDNVFGSEPPKAAPPAGGAAPSATAFNPITGEAYATKDPTHTSTRVHQPPGGASTKLW